MDSYRVSTVDIPESPLSFFMTMQGVTPLLFSTSSCAAGNGRFWNIHRTHPIWVHEITISSPKWNNYCEWPGTTRDEFTDAIRRSIRKINKDGLTDGVRRLPNISKKVIRKGATIRKVHKCCTPVNKAMSKISNSCHYLYYRGFKYFVSLYKRKWVYFPTFNERRRVKVSYHENTAFDSRHKSYRWWIGHASAHDMVLSRLHSHPTSDFFLWEYVYLPTYQIWEGLLLLLIQSLQLCW